MSLLWQVLVDDTTPLKPEVRNLTDIDAHTACVCRTKSCGE
jgi:hypothetical protein